MRTISALRLAILGALLVVTALLAHLHPVNGVQKTGKEQLRQAFAKIDGWALALDEPLDPGVVRELELDSYLFQSYVRDHRVANLYIGYYLSAKKVGAAHDPLVCFKGQGWQIANRESGEYRLARDPDLKISYSSMIAQREEDRELVLYWFQASGKTAATTQAQKIALLFETIAGRGEENAFVRITAPIGAERPEVVRKRLFEFIEGFYPDFYRYVTRT